MIFEDGGKYKAAQGCRTPKMLRIKDFE